MPSPIDAATSFMVEMTFPMSRGLLRWIESRISRIDGSVGKVALMSRGCGGLDQHGLAGLRRIRSKG